MKGDYVPGSDADLLVILEADPRPFTERIPEFRRWFFGNGSLEGLTLAQFQSMAR